MELAEHDRAAVVVTFADITDRRREEQQRRRAEEELRLAFDAAPVGMAVVGLDGRLLRVNDALARLLGRSRARSCRGRHVGELLLPHDMPRISGRARQLVAGEATAVREELSLLVHRGPPTWVLMSATLVRDADGPVHFLVQMQDIEGRKRAEDRLRHLADHDSLTGLLNRRAFEQILAQERPRAPAAAAAARCCCSTWTASRTVNDTLGHAAGDRRDRGRRARARRAAARPPTSWPGSAGTSSPCCCPTPRRPTPARSPQALLERARREAFEDPTAAVRARSRSASASRCSTTPAAARAGSALVRADSAMYAAKAAGRDGWRLAAGGARGRHARRRPRRAAVPGARRRAAAASGSRSGRASSRWPTRSAPGWRA